MASEPPTRTPAAGGAWLAAALLLGTLAGAVLGQPSLGFVGGLAIGIAIAVAIWLRDRKAGP